MNENKELQTTPEKDNLPVTAGKPTGMINPRAEVAFATECANALMEVIIKKPKKVVINGEQYLEFEDWQTIARFYQSTVSVEWTKALTNSNQAKGTTEFVGYEARAVVLDRKGMILSAAEASCTIAEARWRGRDRFQLKSMAQTRACAKALRNVFSWVVVMTGFRTTPAEEFEQYGDNDSYKPNTAQPVYRSAETASNEPEVGQVVETPKTDSPVGAYLCNGCGKEVADVVVEYSKKWFNGNTLCRDCQGQDKWQRIKTR